MVHVRLGRLIAPVGLLLIIIVVSGCAAHLGPTAQAERPRALTKEDVVNMATSDIGDDVIISQIKATGSCFRLSVSDIVELKEAGVSEKVIEYMITTGQQYGREARHEVHYLWHPYYPHYYSIYPWYPGVRVVYINGSYWHHFPRRGRPGVWVKARTWR